MSPQRILVAALFSAAGVASAAPLSTSVTIFESYEEDRDVLARQESNGSFFSQASAAVTAVSGREGRGGAGLIAFAAEGEARARPGLLGASSYAALKRHDFEGPMDEFAEEEDEELEELEEQLTAAFSESSGPDSSPTSYIVRSIARYEDLLSYEGSFDSYTSQYVLGVEGKILGDDTSVIIRVTQGDAPTQEFVFEEPGHYDLDLTTDEFFHDGEEQLFVMELLTIARVDMRSARRRGYDVSIADFGNTVELRGVELRDSGSGEIAPEGEVEGDTGGEIVIVPEPMTLVASLAALAIVATQRSRLR